jgi:hypothetical protein
MLLFRSIVVGLLGACCLLLAVRPRCEIAVRSLPAGPARVSSWEGPRPTIIDVAPLIAPGELAKLLRLAPGEHVIAIDDARVAGDLEAGALLAKVELAPKHYVDLTVAGSLGERRVLVLLH